MAESEQEKQRNGGAWFRSPLLMNRDDSALLVVDVQEKLVPAIANNQRIVWNISRLLEAATILGVATCGTEQYPKGLGRTIEPLATSLKLSSNSIPEKTMFSCRECRSLFDQMSQQGIHNILICGIETHVCIAQTALDLIANGFNVFVCVDAVGSRFDTDHQTALRRLENAGATLTTTEAAMFEWCEGSSDQRFKEVSKLVQQTEP